LDESGSIKKISYRSLIDKPPHRIIVIHKSPQKYLLVFSSTSLIIDFLLISKEPVLIVFLLIGKQHRKQNNAAFPTDPSNAVAAPFPTKQRNTTEEMKGVMPSRTFMVRGPGADAVATVVWAGGDEASTDRVSAHRNRVSLFLAGRLTMMARSCSCRPRAWWWRRRSSSAA
jgi:hypothetical protein